MNHTHPLCDLFPASSPSGRRGLGVLLAMTTLCLAGCGGPRQSTIEVVPSAAIVAQPDELNDGRPLLVDVVIETRDDDVEDEVVDEYLGDAESWFRKAGSPSQELGRSAGRQRVKISERDLQVFRFIYAGRGDGVPPLRFGRTPMLDNIKQVWVMADFPEPDEPGDASVELPGQVARSAGGVTVRLHADRITVDR